MSFVLPRTIVLLQALKLTHLSSSNASVRFSSKGYKFSSVSCQHSLEVGDNSAGEVHEEVQTQRSATTLQEENREEQLVKKAETHERVPLHVSSEPEPEPEVHLRGFPLRAVVESCVKRWFKEHLKAAEKGDSDAQVTIGQMICHGYGVPKDVHKGEEWLRRVQGRRKSKQSKEPRDKKKEENEEFFFM